MIGKIYRKNLTFLQDQPFAEDILTAPSAGGISYRKNRAGGRNKPASEARFTSKDSSLLCPLFISDLRSFLGTQAAHVPLKRGGGGVQGAVFGTNRVRNKSERMKKAEISLVKHFCLLFLERTTAPGEAAGGFCTNVFDDSLYYFHKPQPQAINPNPGINKPLLDSSLKVYHENVSAFGYKVGDVIPHLLVSVDSMRNTLLGIKGSRSPERVKTPSQFKKTLRESRKVRLLYGNLSRRHLSRATNKMHLPGENLLLWLESRLDVVLERCGFFTSVKAARQAVVNGQITVNSKIMRSPGFLLNGGDLIKITQERLLLESSNKQLRRDGILSNKVFSRLMTCKSQSISNFDVSKLPLQGTISKALPDFNTGLQERAPYPGSPCNSAGRLSRRGLILGDNKATHGHLQRVGEKGFDSFSFPVYGFFPNSSFYAWLVNIQKSMGQKGEFLGYPRQPLPSTNIWRFLGSPHLKFSYSFFHMFLKEVLLLIAETLNKDVLPEKRVDLLNPYSTQQRQHTGLLTKATRPAAGAGFSYYYSIACMRASSPFSSISSAWNFCGVNTLATNAAGRLRRAGAADSQKRLVGGFRTADLYNNELLDCTKLESFIKVLCQFLKKTKVNKDVTAPRRRAVHHNHFLFYGVVSPRLQEEGVVKSRTSYTNGGGRSPRRRGLWNEMAARVSASAEIYNTLFSSLSPMCFNKDIFLTKDKDRFLRVASIIERNDRDFLSVRLSDLLLYSLLIKKEILYGQLKKQQSPDSGLAVSLISEGKTISCSERIVNLANPHVKEMYPATNKAAPAAGTGSVDTNQHWIGGCTDSRSISGPGQQKVYETIVRANHWLPLNSSRGIVDSQAAGRISSLKVAAPGEAAAAPAAGDKKRHISEVFDKDRARRIKPLHLEISHRSLCAIFLYPPQRVCLPIMIDVECLLKSL